MLYVENTSRFEPGITVTTLFDGVTPSEFGEGRYKQRGVLGKGKKNSRGDKFRLQPTPLMPSSSPTPGHIGTKFPSLDAARLASFGFDSTRLTPCMPSLDSDFLGPL
jgi:hypothetical protein